MIIVLRRGRVLSFCCVPLPPDLLLDLTTRKIIIAIIISAIRTAEPMMKYLTKQHDLSSPSNFTFSGGEIVFNVPNIIRINNNLYQRILFYHLFFSYNSALDILVFSAYSARLHHLYSRLLLGLESTVVYLAVSLICCFLALL